jgi:hypothetical protein
MRKCPEVDDVLKINLEPTCNNSSGLVPKVSIIVVSTKNDREEKKKSSVKIRQSCLLLRTAKYHIPYTI